MRTEDIKKMGKAYLEVKQGAAQNADDASEVVVSEEGGTAKQMKPIKAKSKPAVKLDNSKKKTVGKDQHNTETSVEEASSKHKGPSPKETSASHADSRVGLRTPREDDMIKDHDKKDVKFDHDKVNKLNFKTFKTMTKKAKARPNDQKTGDSKIVKPVALPPGTKVQKESASGSAKNNNKPSGPFLFRYTGKKSDMVKTPGLNKDKSKPAYIGKMKRHVKEDAEEVSELSKGTMGSFIKKSLGDRKGSMSALKKNVDSTHGSLKSQQLAKDSKRKLANRKQGVNRAVNKLVGTKELLKNRAKQFRKANEDAEISELSSATLRSFVRKRGYRSSDPKKDASISLAVNKVVKKAVSKNSLGSAIKRLDLKRKNKLPEDTTQEEEVVETRMMTIPEVRKHRFGIVELSKKTLGSFVKKSVAPGSTMDQDRKIVHNSKQFGAPGSVQAIERDKRAAKRLKNRHKAVDKALDKITKEETVKKLSETTDPKKHHENHSNDHDAAAAEHSDEHSSGGPDHFVNHHMEGERRHMDARDKHDIAGMMHKKYGKFHDSYKKAARDAADASHAAYSHTHGAA